MAVRQVFVPGVDTVKQFNIEFKWIFNDLPATVDLLHKSARKRKGLTELLEVSGASPLRLGRDLSAFDLPLKTRHGIMTVESAYQGSKVYEDRNVNHDLYTVNSKTAKMLAKKRKKGRIVSFNFFGEEFSTEPKTYFYNWVYISTLLQKPKAFIPEVSVFRGFTDIFANPDRTLNCQARALALFIVVMNNSKLKEQLLSPLGLLQREQFHAFSVKL